MSHFHLSPRRTGHNDQNGFTLVELMVAMVLGLLVAAAGVAALIIGRQGFTTVDNATQLRETARYAASAIDQAAIEVGFQNAAYGMFNTSAPTLRGYDNSLVFPAFASLPTGLAHDTRTSANCGAAVGTACQNGSDVLVVNFWGASRNGNADGTMINCGGIAEPEGAGPLPAAYSILHVATASTGEINAEPALACTYRDPLAGTWKTVPIVQGVESFQVMYGVFGITAGACAAAPATPSTPSATVSNLQTPTETYFTAKQMDGPSGYCANNWTYVRNLRIGLLVRGPLHSAQNSVAKTWKLMAAQGEPLFASGATLNTVADGRLRQQMVFTIHIRNSL
jgi:type IV pilus assembly protein PilW